MDLNDFFSKVIAVGVVVMLGSVAWKNRSRLNYTISVWRRFTPWLFFEALLILVVVLYIGLLLYQLPILDLGWYKFLNPDQNATNITITPALSFGDAVGIGFIAFLLVLIPYLAEYEEKEFRDGKFSKSEFFPSAVIFGLVHMIMGIPLAFGLALILAGLGFSRKYITTYHRLIKTPRIKIRKARNEALQTSTALHTMFNSIVLSIVALSLVLT